MSRKKTLCRLYIDLPADSIDIPKLGQFLVTRGAKGYGSVYLLTAVREVERRTRAIDSRRFALTVQRGYTLEEAMPTGPIVLCWYPREKKSAARLT